MTTTPGAVTSRQVTIGEDATAEPRTEAREQVMPYVAILLICTGVSIAAVRRRKPRRGRGD